MREYQTLKARVCHVTGRAEPLADLSSLLRDAEETKRALAKVRGCSVRLTRRS